MTDDLQVTLQEARASIPQHVDDSQEWFCHACTRSWAVVGPCRRPGTCPSMSAIATARLRRPTYLPDERVRRAERDESPLQPCDNYRGNPCQDDEDGGCICDVRRERDGLRARFEGLVARNRALEGIAIEFDELRVALEFYADPDTYFAIGIFPDRPCGELVDDYSIARPIHYDGGEEMCKPGKRARAALGIEQREPEDDD